MATEDKNINGPEIKIEGPITPKWDFYNEHLDLSIPELSKIKPLLKSREETTDFTEANHIFAEYIRKFLHPEVLNKSWIEKEYTSEEKEKLTKSAKDIMDYKFVSCGIPHQFEKGKIDWFFNPTYNAYKEWPWQLSRHPELTRLAEYYTLTKDEEAAKTYQDMLTSWFRQSLLPKTEGAYQTVTWRTIEAGIRMNGWSRQIHAFISSPNITDEFIVDYFISIYEHAWRITTFCTRGNWLLMEMHGLTRISLLYTFFKKAKEWNEFALKKLEAEFDIQVYPDGFQYELSTNYHNVVDNNYYNILELYKILGIKPPRFLETKLEKLYDMYPHLVRPDGRLPDLNDGAHIPILGKMRNAYGLNPEREDFEYFATEGKEGKKPKYLSYVFPYAGAAVMRTSWEKDAIWAYMDCSPFGEAHQHEDKLNVLIYAYGKNMLVEAGNYDYDSSEMRKYVLSSRSHNTVRLGNEDQSQRKIYRWHDEDINEKAGLEFETTNKIDMAASTYNKGYGPDGLKYVHKRKLMFFKDVDGTSPFFAVIDRFYNEEGNEDKVTYEQMWHYDTLDFVLDNNYVNGNYGDGIGLSMAFSDKDANVKDMIGQYEPYYQGFMPIRPSGPHEHRKTHTPVLVGDFVNSKRVVTILYPYKDNENVLLDVSASSDVNDVEFKITLTDGEVINLSEEDI